MITSCDRSFISPGHRDGRAWWPFALAASINQHGGHHAEPTDAVVDVLQRAQRLLDENVALLAGVVDLAAGRHRLDEVLSSLSAPALDQDVGDRGAKGDREAASAPCQTVPPTDEPIAVIARGTTETCDGSR